jgi:hypothetical protein
MLTFPFPDMQVRGAGTVKPPPLTDRDLAEMWGRAERVQDQQIQTDLFRLLTAVEALTDTFDAFAKGKK